MLSFESAAQDSARSARSTTRELVDEWLARGRFEPSPDNWMRGFDRDFSRAMAERGLIGLTWPVEHGGGGGRNVDRLAVTEELLRSGAPVAAHWMADRQIGPAILRHGTPQLKAEILPGIVSADHVFCLGMSEPESGSDLASVHTSATRTADGWRLRGRKVWTTGAHHATHMYVLARSEKSERKHEGLTELIVDMVSAGVHVSPILDLQGEHHFNEVLFDDVLVPDSRVLGTPGQGWSQVVEQLSFERGGPERILSSYPLLDAVLSAPSVAEGHDDVAIGEIVARLATLRRLSFRLATRMDAGIATARDAATLKMLGNAFEQDLVDLARTVHGSSPVATSLLGRAIAAMPGFTIRGGAADVMLALIARQEQR